MMDMEKYFEHAGLFGTLSGCLGLFGDTKDAIRRVSRVSSREECYRPFSYVVYYTNSMRFYVCHFPLFRTFLVKKRLLRIQRREFRGTSLKLRETIDTNLLSFFLESSFIARVPHRIQKLVSQGECCQRKERRRIYLKKSDIFA